MALVTNQQHRDQVCQLVTEAVIMLCKNLLTFSNNLCIEGLIGVTADSTNVILVNIKETIASNSDFTEGETSCQLEVHSSPMENSHKSPKLKRRRSNSSEVEQSQIWTGSKHEIVPEKLPTEIAERSNSITEASVKCIKQEHDPVPCPDQYDRVHVGQTVLGESCSSPKQFNNDPPVPTGWPECSALRLPLTLPESTLVPWSQVTGSLEQIQSKEAYELIDRQHLETPHLPHSNKISFTIGKDRNLLRHPRIATSEHSKKHGPLSFAVEKDPSGSELFVCECGEPFRHRSSLYRHQMVHLGMAYRCDLCGIIMNRKDNLLTHKRRYCLAQKQMNSKF